MIMPEAWNRWNVRFQPKADIPPRQELAESLAKNGRFLPVRLCYFVYTGLNEAY